VRKLEEKNTELEQAQARLTNLNAELEARVKARTAELEAANLELEAFNQSVAHDLRNPLTTVLGLTQFLVDAESSLGEEERPYPRMILGSAERMSALLDDLMKL